MNLLTLLRAKLLSSLFLMTSLLTQGQTLLKDIVPGPSGSQPTSLINVNGTLFFLADDAIHGRELWKSDGTAAGTVLVKDIYPGPKSSDIQDMVVANGLLFFTAYSTLPDSQSQPTNSRQVWRSDGTAGGTFEPYDGHKDGEVNMPSSLTRMGDQVFYINKNSLGGQDGWFLTKSNGTGSIYGQKSVGTGVCAGFDSFSYVPQPPKNLNEVNGTLFFTYNGFLWKATGQPTDQVFALTKIKAFPTFGTLRAYQNKLFFSVGGELWTSDGSTENTQPVASTGPDPIVSLTPAGSYLYLVGGKSGRLLWTSQGTEATTELRATLPGFIRSVTNSLHNALIPPPSKFTSPKGDLTYFMAGDELYNINSFSWMPNKAQGTYAGVTNFVKVGSTLYFITTTGLYRTVETLAKALPVFTVPVSFSTFSLTSVANRLYLSTVIPDPGQEVYYVTTP